MPAPLSEDLRERLMKDVRRGSSLRAVALRFDVSASAVERLVRHEAATGSVSPKQIGGYRKPILAGQEAFLRAQVAAKPGVTLKELKAALAAQGVVVGSLNTIHLMLGRLGLTHKKRASTRKNKRGTMSRSGGGSGGCISKASMRSGSSS